MTTCDVLIVGAGPAGSSCARRLVQAGIDVVIADRAAFPRDKVCTGWITPETIDALELDLTDYAAGRTLQPFTGFALSRWDDEPILCDFDRPVSYGIRRVELDDYLLRRSGARARLSYGIRTLRRDGSRWRADDDLMATIVIGAGGHDCPVAREMNPDRGHETIVAAQDAEFRAPDGSLDPPASRPSLVVWPDLLGYGWVVRKGEFLSVGAGRLHDSAWSAAMQDFHALLRRRRVAGVESARFRGHAYLLNTTSRRRLAGDGLILAGDAAGLALAPSGEGILAAAESGAMAAATAIAALQGDRSAFDAYAAAIVRRFGPRATGRARPWPAWVGPAVSRLLFKSPKLARRLLLERSFLHQNRDRRSAALTA